MITAHKHGFHDLCQIHLEATIFLFPQSHKKCHNFIICSLKKITSFIFLCLNVLPSNFIIGLLVPALWDDNVFLFTFDQCWWLCKLLKISSTLEILFVFSPLGSRLKCLSVCGAFFLILVYSFWELHEEFKVKVYTVLYRCIQLETMSFIFGGEWWGCVTTRCQCCMSFTALGVQECLLLCSAHLLDSLIFLQALCFWFVWELSLKFLVPSPNVPCIFFFCLFFI